MQEVPDPVLMFSSLTHEGARVTLDAWMPARSTTCQEFRGHLAQSGQRAEAAVREDPSYRPVNRRFAWRPASRRQRRKRRAAPATARRQRVGCA